MISLYANLGGYVDQSEPSRRLQVNRRLLTTTMRASLIDNSIPTTETSAQPSTTSPCQA